MADIVDAATRSRMMSRIRSKDTGIEMTVRRYLFKAGFRFRLHQKDLPGKPDLYLKKYGVVIFVHGCFWHGHMCHLFHLPKSRIEWWQEKINGNKVRDRRNLAACRRAGLRVIQVWECQLRDHTEKQVSQTLLNVVRRIRSPTARSAGD